MIIMGDLSLVFDGMIFYGNHYHITQSPGQVCCTVQRCSTTVEKDDGLCVFLRSGGGGTGDVGPSLAATDARLIRTYGLSPPAPTGIQRTHARMHAETPVNEVRGILRNLFTVNEVRG